MSTRLRLVVGVIVVALVVAAGIVESPASSPMSTLVGAWGGHDCPKVTVAHPVELPNQGRAPATGGVPYPATVGAAGRINSVLQASYSNVFSGVALSNQNTTINVYATSLSPELKAVVARIAPKGSVTYYRCGNSLSSLYAVQQVLNYMTTARNRQGIDIAGWGTAITSNCEEIDVLKLTRPQLELLQRDFGADRICVHGITPQQEGRPL